MPTGVYVGQHGAKRSCSCGACPKCHQIAYYYKRFKNRKAGDSKTDAELERELIEKFKREGWDK